MLNSQEVQQINAQARMFSPRQTSFSHNATHQAAYIRTCLTMQCKDQDREGYAMLVIRTDEMIVITAFDVDPLTMLHEDVG